MKNTFVFLLAVTLLVAVVLGCSKINPFSEKPATNASRANSNKSLTDKAVDTTVGEEKIGIPECDEAIDMLTEYANNPDDNFVVKAGKAMFVNKIKESIKKSIEENKGDKVEIAKNCKDAKTQLQKYKAEEDGKKK